MQPQVNIVTLQQSELQDMLFQAAKLGAEQAIKSIKQQTAEQSKTLDNEKPLWDMKDCAEYLGETYPNFRDKTSQRRGFPKPAKRDPNATRRDSWRWLPKDIKAWANARH